MLQVAQFDIGSLREVGVQAKYLDSEGYLVDDALAGTVAATEKFKVCKAVVLAVAVYVVHGFFAVKLATERLSHHIAMLHNRVFFAGDKRRHADPYIAMSFDMASVFSVLKALQSTLFNAFVSAVFLFAVKPATGFAALTKGFSTVDAGKGVSLLRIFSAANIGTRARAIKRAAFMFFDVSIKVRTHHTERLAAFLAGERQNLSPWSYAGSPEAFGTSTSQTAKTPVVAWITEKGLFAIFANSLNRHGTISPVGRRQTVVHAIHCVK
jgi:hypothetical protein